MGTAGLVGRPVPVHHILREWVVGREVETAAEVPVGILVDTGGFDEKEPQVHVGRRHVWVAGMHYQRNRGRLEGLSRQVRVAIRGGGREAVTDRVGVQHRGLFDVGTVLQHPGPGKAAVGQGGGFTLECPLAVQGREFRLDLVLQVAEELAHGLDSYSHGGFRPEISDNDARGLPPRVDWPSFMCRSRLVAVLRVAGLAEIMQ